MAGGSIGLHDAIILYHIIPCHPALCFTVVCYYTTQIRAHSLQLGNLYDLRLMYIPLRGAIDVQTASCTCQAL